MLQQLVMTQPKVKFYVTLSSLAYGALLLLLHTTLHSIQGWVAQDVTTVYWEQMVWL